MHDQDTSQTQRQMHLLSLLSDNHRPYSLSSLQESLERVGISVSRKTVERDIDTLSTEFCICEEEKNGVTVFYADKYHLKNIQYSIPELLSLYFICEVLNDYAGMEIADHARLLVNRLIASAPSVSRRYIETLSGLIKINQLNITPEVDIDMDIYTLIQRALSEQKQLQIEYHSFNNNETTHRLFDPYILEIQEGRWHLVGYCHLRGAVRDLRVSRIRDAKSLDTGFSKPENFYEAHRRSRFERLAGDHHIRLRIRFTGLSARLVEEYKADKAHLLQWINDDTLIYERNASMTPEILMWLLSFGAEAEVLEPESLRQAVKKEAVKLAALYE